MSEPEDKPAPKPLLQGPKRQHYLPEFYLKGFCKEGLVCVFDRERSTYRLQTPLNTGVIGHLYTVRDAESRQRFEVEALLSRQEAAAADVINKLLRREQISSQERQAMAVFVALAFTRIPERLDEFAMLRESLVLAGARAMWGTPERAQELINEIGEGPFTAEQWSDLVHNELKVEIAKEAQIEDMITMADHLAPLLAKMSWVVLHRPSESTSFVTSDSPVCLLPPRGLDPGFYGIGFGLRGTETRFPLSQAACLCLINEGALDHYLHVTCKREDVRTVNLTTTAACRSYVLGRDEALIRNLVQKTGIDQTPFSPKLRID